MVERTISKPIGKLIYLPQQYKTSIIWQGGLEYINNAIKNHDIDAVISALEEAEYK